MNASVPFPFFASKRARVELARQRYFEEGLLPSGVVSDAVYESWARCQRLHASPSEKVAFQPVSPSRTHLALQKNHELVQAWLDELPKLQSVLGATSCAAMLTDASGVIVGATCVGRAHESIMPIATRVGVNLCEEAVGTTAPGVAARTGLAVSVDGAEHFFDTVGSMHCAAAPIRNIRGQLAGVLDISSEAIPFCFDATAIVGLYAAAIENRLFLSQASEHLVVRFQIDPALVDSNFVALVGVDKNGDLAWANNSASRLLGLGPVKPRAQTTSVGAAFDATTSQLASLPRSGAGLLRLANGLMVWARSEMKVQDGHRDLVLGVDAGRLDLDAANSRTHTASSNTPTGMTPAVRIHLEAVHSESGDSLEPMHAPEQQAPSQRSPRLQDCGKDLIEQTLAACEGNLTRAAEILGVSRGLIYRRLGRPARPSLSV